MRFNALFAAIDAGDVKFAVGLSLLTAGIALISVPWAFIITGVIILAGFYAIELVKVFGPRRQDRGGSK